MTAHEPVTIGERYRKATVSSNIRPEARRSGDADLLIAAGWADSLGIKLYRLAGEFDQVARDLHRTNNKTDAILVLGRLKTLTQARVALVGFAMDAAPRWGLSISEQEIGLVAGNCLAAFLESVCSKCNGVGLTGGYDGNPTAICNRCRGSGKPTANLGRTDAQRYLAARLLSVMDSLISQADAILLKYLRA